MIPSPKPSLMKFEEAPGTTQRRKQGGDCPRSPMIQEAKVNPADPVQLQNLFHFPPPSSKEFRRLKFKNSIYKIGDIIFVNNENDHSNNFIGKILKIRSFLVSDNNYIVGCLVQWYYRKSDLKISKFKHILSHISEFEVFQSKHEDAILADTINGLCQVLTLKEYEERDDFRTQTNCFFTRAFFDVKNGILDPPVEQWARYCLCQKPINPDIPVIQCELCEEWYHFGCVGISIEKAENIDTYFCPKCQEKEPNSNEKESNQTQLAPQA